MIAADSELIVRVSRLARLHKVNSILLSATFQDEDEIESRRYFSIRYLRYANSTGNHCPEFEEAIIDALVLGQEEERDVSVGELRSTKENMIRWQALQRQRGVLVFQQGALCLP